MTTNRTTAGKDVNSESAVNSDSYAVNDADNGLNEAKKRKRGRPPSRIMAIDATPEEIAKAIFANVKPPNPALRKHNKGG